MSKQLRRSSYIVATVATNLSGSDSTQVTSIGCSKLLSMLYCLLNKLKRESFIPIFFFLDINAVTPEKLGDLVVIGLPY
jgi:hypothetical protein